MIKYKEIAFTCYAVTNMARARKFYEGVLGLKPTVVFGEPGGMQWTEYDIASGTLAPHCFACRGPAIVTLFLSDCSASRARSSPKVLPLMSRLIASPSAILSPVQVAVLPEISNCSWLPFMCQKNAARQPCASRGE